MKAKEQIEVLNKYGQRKESIPRSQVVESKKKYNRKKDKKIKEEEYQW